MNLLDELRHIGPDPLHSEGRLPSFKGATGWLNSEPLEMDDLRGKVVLVDFWTYTCINWLRTLPYVRAWAHKYKDHGLVVVGVHTPEFPFEQDVDNVRQAAEQMRVIYPIALDPDYMVWNDFSNHYWPAAYFADAEGRIRHHQFGEGQYDEQEQVIQQLLREAGMEGFDDGLADVTPEGVTVAADFAHLGTPESYVGYQQAQGLASANGVELDEPHTYVAPESLGLNQWSLSGNWTVEGRSVVGNEANGTIAFRYHARDANLVMGSRPRETPVRFQVRVDGQPPGDAHGVDVDADGNGTVVEQRLYQLVREPPPNVDRTIELTFLDSGADLYCWTFG
jgi:thiol-disulfide isomerase/thioredoxin